jgi:hypothetical protein
LDPVSVVIRDVFGRRAAKVARTESRAGGRRKAPSLVDVPPRPPRPPWHGRLELLPMLHGLCPDCARTLNVVVGADALALFWIHGFGAVVRTTFVSCPCGYRRHWTTQTVTPRTKDNR